MIRSANALRAFTVPRIHAFPITHVTCQISFIRSDSVTFTDNYALRRSYHVIIEYFCMPTTPENISYLYGGPEI